MRLRQIRKVIVHNFPIFKKKALFAAEAGNPATPSRSAAA